MRNNQKKQLKPHAIDKKLVYGFKIIKFLVL